MNSLDRDLFENGHRIFISSKLDFIWIFEISAVLIGPGLVSQKIICLFKKINNVRILKDKYLKYNLLKKLYFKYLKKFKNINILKKIFSLYIYILCLRRMPTKEIGI